MSGLVVSADNPNFLALRTVLGYDVSPESSERLIAYVRLLREWQGRMNLVSSSTLDSVWTRHIADSARAYSIAPDATAWIDLGSGAGFPGLVIAILVAESSGGRIDGHIDLIESNSKKCSFLGVVLREIDLRASGVTVTIHNARIEHIIDNLPSGILVSRALAPLCRLLEFSNTRLRDGRGLFFKGRDYAREIEVARRDWQFDVTNHESCFDGLTSPILEVGNVHPR